MGYYFKKQDKQPKQSKGFKSFDIFQEFNSLSRRTRLHRSKMDVLIPPQGGRGKHCGTTSPLNPNFVDTSIIPSKFSSKMVLYGECMDVRVVAINPLWLAWQYNHITQGQYEKLNTLWTIRCQRDNRTHGCVPVGMFKTWIHMVLSKLSPSLGISRKQGKALKDFFKLYWG